MTSTELEERLGVGGEVDRPAVIGRTTDAGVSSSKICWSGHWKFRKAVIHTDLL